MEKYNARKVEDNLSSIEQAVEIIQSYRARGESVYVEIDGTIL